MLWFAVITLFPEMFTALSDHGISGRAFRQDKTRLTLINPRDFSDDPNRRVDDRPFGGGPGMVMQAPPLARAIRHARDLAVQDGVDDPLVIYLSPQGKGLTESRVVTLGQHKALILLCGRYEGIDERLLDRYVDLELSIGDYVLSGGELPAMVLMDSLIRRLPSVMGDERSAQEDSFVDGLLDCPHYTRPEEFEGMVVPEVLKSGHHAAIERWRLEQKLLRTHEKRPDLLEHAQLSPQHRQWLKERTGQRNSSD